jgi:pyruvate kinase
LKKVVAAMRVFSPALSFLLLVTADGFSPISIGRPSTILHGGGGMDAYDAQMAALVQNQKLAREGPASSVANRSAPSLGYGAASSYLDTLSRTDAIAADMLNASRKASTAASAPAKTDNFKSSPRWRKKTKQLATLGPASSTFEMIEKLFLAGADVFRLNFSHGEHAQKKELLDIIRQIEAKYDHPIAILGDLQGPKIRTGTFANPAGELLQAGQIFRFDSDKTPGNAQRVFLPHPEIIDASEVGHVLLIDDGKVKVVVVAKGPGYLDCEVVVGGMIKDRKGVNTPDSILEISCLTPKDREDLNYMLSIGVDWVALSFVQRPQDIVEIKRLIMSYNPNNANPPHIMAKIEKPSCFWDDNLRRIVELCDGISKSFV